MSRLIKVCSWTGPLRGSVIFVHGLGGDAYQTWRRDADVQSFWPMWLGQDVEGLSVYTLSYDAPPTNWLGTAMPLQDRVVNVMETLLAEPRLRQGPVCFICHSLGGLIVKQLLLDLQQQQGRRADAADLLSRIRQIVFIATPHTGSRQGTLLDRLRFIAWPTAIARTLVANDPTLRAINVAYRGLADERRDVLRHRVFYETCGTPAGVIVDEASADPGLPGDPPVPIDADHLSIVKPSDRGALLYLRIRDFVTQMPLAAAATPRLFETFPLPPIARETPRNLLPKLLRVVLIGLVGVVGYKGVQTLIAPPPLVSHAEFDALRRQTEETHALTKQLYERFVASNAAAAPSAEKAIEAAVAASVAGAAQGNARMQHAVDLLKQNRITEAQEVFQEVAASQERAADAAAKAAAAQTQSAKRDAQQAAAAYRHLGAIAGLHDMKAARDAYAKAAALDPHDAEGLLWNGWFQLQTDNLVDAEKSLRVALSPDAVGADLEKKFWAYIGLGNLAEIRGDLTEAQKQYRSAKDELSSLASSPTPNDGDRAAFEERRDLGRFVVMLKEGDLFFRRMKLDEAAAAYQEALDLATSRSQRAPQNEGWRLGLIMCNTALGNIAFAGKKFVEALQRYDHGLAIAKELAEAEPKNKAFQASVAAFEERRGDVFSMDQKPALAKEAYLAALEDLRQAVEADPANEALRNSQALLYGKLSDVEIEQTQYEDANAHYRLSHDIVESLAKTDWSNANRRNSLALSYMRLSRNEILAALNIKEVAKRGPHLQAALDALVNGRNIMAGLAAEHPGDLAWKNQLDDFDANIERQKKLVSGVTKDEPAPSTLRQRSKRRR